MKKKNVWKLLFSLLVMVATMTLLYSTNFLDLEIVGVMSMTLIVQILIGTLGFFWMLALTTQPLRQNIYFTSGVIMIIVALYSLALSQFDVPRIELLSELSIFEALTIMFAGIFLMMHGWLSIPKSANLKFST